MATFHVVICVGPGVIQRLRVFVNLELRSAIGPGDIICKSDLGYLRYQHLRSRSAYTPRRSLNSKELQQARQLSLVAYRRVMKPASTPSQDRTGRLMVYAANL